MKASVDLDKLLAIIHKKRIIAFENDREDAVDVLDELYRELAKLRTKKK